MTRSVKRYVPIAVGVVLLNLGLLAVFVPSPGDMLGQRISGLGVELFGGAVVAFAIFWIERSVSERQRLQLTLGLQQNLTGITLSKADLAGFYLRERTLSKADLTSANLVRANLEEAIFIDADLTGAKLSRANLTGARLQGAILHKALLKRAVLKRHALREQTSARQNFTERI